MAVESQTGECNIVHTKGMTLLFDIMSVLKDPHLIHSFETNPRKIQGT